MSSTRVSLSHLISGMLLIAGTTVGAGMLGIPLLTANAGFFPAILITLVVWIFMILTGFLFLEATLSMHEGANILSMSRKFLGKKGRWVAGSTFVFLYYCLMIAYFAAGAPILAAFIEALFGINIEGWSRFLLFGAVFGSIVSFGIKWVNRFNYLLMVGMVISYFILIGAGSSEIVWQRLEEKNWQSMLFAAPVLFSSFGYHNVIPSLTQYFNRNVKVMRFAIFWGTFIPLLIYILWQWLIIGAIPKEAVDMALKEGKPVTETLQSITNNRWIQSMGRSFGFFAIVTSMLGVAFSMVDFLGDGLKMKRKGSQRLLLVLMTFIPPLILASVDPTIFVTAIGVAGGFGEAFLNGILPVSLVWVGRYHMRLDQKKQVGGGQMALVTLFAIAVFVIILETFLLINRY